jgi:outer membrane murein-binding lipoprotein Lpp
MATEPVPTAPTYGPVPPAPLSTQDKPRLTKRPWFWPVVAGVAGLVVGSVAAAGGSPEPTASQITGSTQYTELESKVAGLEDELATAQDDVAKARSAAEDAQADVTDRDARIKTLEDAAAAPAPAVVAPAAPPAAAPAAEPETFTMPALVGVNLQLAQDQLQALGSYVMDQTDASGLGRVQVLDSNWKVCAQQPAAGSVVPLDAVVTLASVKLDERCP